MEDEIWKPVVGYEGLYEVSNLGNVKALEKSWVCGKNNVRFCHQEEKLLKKNGTRKDGRLTVILSKDGKIKSHKIHRLVAQAFLPNPNNLPEINHKDENPQNNNVNNLEWCDHKYNTNYGTRNQRISDKLINSPQKSKQVYQYTLDNQLVKVWESTAECGRNGFDNSHVGRCCLNKPRYKTHKGFRWSYTPLEAPNA